MIPIERRDGGYWLKVGPDLRFMLNVPSRGPYESLREARSAARVWEQAIRADQKSSEG